MRLLIRQLKTAIAKLGETDFCPHTLGEVTFPSGRVETFAPCHLCGLPPLVAVLNYQDGRITPRTVASARAALAKTAEKFPEVSEAERRASVSKAYGIDEKLL